MKARDLEKLVAHHQQRRAEAEEAYRKLLDPDTDSQAWRLLVREAEQQVVSTLGSTSDLTEVAGALHESGEHMLVLRFFMGPPLSQDQFSLACREWVKGSETRGHGMDEEAAACVAAAFARWADPSRVQACSPGARAEDRRAAVSATAHMMALNKFRTTRRMSPSRKQEQQVAILLEQLGFRRVPSIFVDQPGTLAEDEFMCATQFKTADGSTHEVDVAVGLPKRTILALECKVSNDATNSVKRVNDVLKKASAWKRQWGKFVITGALLQGVFSAKEPRRLVEEDVEVFWSHRLDELESWLQEQRGQTG